MSNSEKFLSDYFLQAELSLFMAPGTGKTSIAEAVANEMNILLKVVNAGKHKSKWVGETI